MFFFFFFFSSRRRHTRFKCDWSSDVCSSDLMDDDTADVFDRTVAWAVEQGIETATFHILTPYPSTALYQRMAAEGRLLHSRWDLYDTRHVVYRPARLSAEELEAGYWRAYRAFYRWGAIFRGAA